MWKQNQIKMNEDTCTLYIALLLKDVPEQWYWVANFMECWYWEPLRQHWVWNLLWQEWISKCVLPTIEFDLSVSVNQRVHCSLGDSPTVGEVNLVASYTTSTSPNNRRLVCSTLCTHAQPRTTSSYNMYSSASVLALPSRFCFCSFLLKSPLYGTPRHYQSQCTL